jgi:hypothetical protein
MIGVMFGWLTLLGQVIKICLEFINITNSLDQVPIESVFQQNQDFCILKMTFMYYLMQIWLLLKQLIVY